MTGKLIILEGLDGSGKSTQFELLQQRGDFPDCVFITFPNYNSHSGRIITDYLSGKINEDDPKVSAYSASSFYAIDRYLSYKESWEKEYKAGKTIIAARYVTSNAIYQMTKLERVEWDNYVKWLDDLEYQKLGLPKEDAVLYLDLPLRWRQKLLAKRYDNNENSFDIHEKDKLFMSNCQETAEYLAKKLKWNVVDCIKDKEIRVIDDLYQEIKSRIKGITDATV